MRSCNAFPSAPRARALLLVPFVLLAACGGTLEPAPLYPGEAWEYVEDVSAVGWSADGLAKVDEQLATLGSTGLLAVHGGRAFFEYGDVEVLSYLASVRKSILSMLYGIYVDRGVVDLDLTLADLGIDDHQGLTDAEKEATIAHLLAARSGVYHPASNSGDNLGQAPERGSQAAGSYYLYSNWDFNAVGAIFEQVTGHDIYDALETDLVVPVGMQDFDRSIHEKSGNLERSRFPAYHMHLSTRDMARIGYLMLREGQWGGEQIVSREWIRKSTRAITPVHEMNPENRRDGPYGYGYLWWVFDGPETKDAYEGAYVGLGAIGQHILVVPKLDLVVAHKTRPGGESVSHTQFLEVADLIVEAHCGNAC